MTTHHRNLPGKNVRKKASRKKKKSEIKVGDNWYTPAPIIARVRQVFKGTINLDPASTEAANAVVGAKDFYTKEMNGLILPWHGKVYINPPFSRGNIKPFADKLIAEWRRDDGFPKPREIICLTNSATETEWHQALSFACDAICEPDARINFWTDVKFPEGEKAPEGNRYAQTIFYFGKNPLAFYHYFKPLGFTFITTPGQPAFPVPGYEHQLFHF